MSNAHYKREQVRHHNERYEANRKYEATMAAHQLAITDHRGSFPVRTVKSPSNYQG